LILAKYRNFALGNLRLAFKEKSERELKHLCSLVFENLGKNLVELLSFPKITEKNVDRLISVSGLQKIDILLKKGKGGVVVSGHLGNWEFLPLYFGLKGYPANVVARRMRFSKYTDWVNDLRSKKNIKVILRQNSFKELLSILTSNQLLGILPDQDVDSVEGVFVDFFGQKAYTPVGPVSLALASGAALITCYIYRDNNHHQIVIDDPIELTISGDKQRDLVVNTEKWQKRIESYIRLYPEQWVWMHKRWKTQNV
jgi:KDO2-lipid IV(A) lauroyltransferase